VITHLQIQQLIPASKHTADFGGSGDAELAVLFG
jgi:hypothetical protein